MIPPYHPVPAENSQPPAEQVHPRATRLTCAHVLFPFMAIAIIVLSTLLARRNPLHEAPELRTIFDPFVISSVISQGSQCGCPYLTIFPFDTGCPTDCTAHRIDLPKNTSFYRTSSAFVFGNLTSFRQHHSPNKPFTPGFPLAKSFIEAEEAVIDSVKERVQEAKLPPLSVHRQSIMRMSSDYLCCLTEREKEIAQEVRARFVASHYNNFPLQLVRVQCVQDQTDSITLIWIADDLTQKLSLRANYALAHAMRAKGVPVLVDRSLQMPFHVKLVSFTASRGQDIATYRKLIQAGVEASGSHNLKTHVDLNTQLSPWELSRNSTEINYPSVDNVEHAFWFLREVCDN
ncbi:hypothetical protein FGB62_62g018 [Gracilaria domingensis]|nr:hypothetical protein FGB62_62g018 [Gracilaria domingensis]